MCGQDLKGRDEGEGICVTSALGAAGKDLGVFLPQRSSVQLLALGRSRVTILTGMADLDHQGEIGFLLYKRTKTGYFWNRGNLLVCLSCAKPVIKVENYLPNAGRDFLGKK